MAIYGNGWHGKGARGPAPYRHQIEHLRAARITVNWDHFPTHVNYASDRLSISLLAGRLHITTRHPGDHLYRTEGLVEVGTVREAVASAQELLRRPWEELHERGLSGWTYARNRLSDREAARFMLRAVDRRIAAPPKDPWDRIESLGLSRPSVTAGHAPLPAGSNNHSVAYR